MYSEYLGKVNNIITSTDIRNLVGLSTTGILIFNDDITWLKFKYNNKILFISNRCVLYGMSWNQMNNVGIATGKTITINDTEYFCRSISATDNGSWNGQPIAGEWKDLIMEYTLNVSDSYWNEYYTLCRDDGQNSSYGVIVGNTSIDNILQLSKTTSHSTYAWRPVLEINPYCNISISDENLGELFNPFSPKNYIVNGSSHTLTEKLDGVVIRTLENQLDGTKYTLDLSSQWDSISYGKHTIEIIATDSNGLLTTVTITFNKIKQPITTLPTTSNLKQAIDYSKEIKKEIEYQSFKLKNNLIEKGVECSDIDKMSSLIDMVNGIIVANNVTAGESIQLFKYTSSAQFNIKQEDILKIVSNVNGSVKIKINYISSGASGSCPLNIDLIRGVSVVSSKTFTLNSYGYYIDIEYDLSEIQLNDVISIYVTGSRGGAIKPNGGITISYDKL